MEFQCCIRCDRQIISGEQAIAVFMFAQTVGIRPRRKSGAQRLHFCPECAVSLALGPSPEGALNMAAYHMIRDLIGGAVEVTQIAWGRLKNTLTPARLTDGSVVQMPRDTVPALTAARAAS